MGDQPSTELVIWNDERQKDIDRMKKWEEQWQAKQAIKKADKEKKLEEQENKERLLRDRARTLLERKQALWKHTRERPPDHGRTGMRDAGDIKGGIDGWRDD